MANWLDGVVGNIARSVDSAKEGSKLFVEKAKLNTDIQNAEREKEKLIKNMGTLVLNLQKSGEIHIEQCAGICGEIDQIDKRIEALKNQIRNLETPKAQYYGDRQSMQNITNGIRCQCGFVNKETAKFCARCGQPLTQGTGSEV